MLTLTLVLVAPAALYLLGALLATGPRWRRVLGFLPAVSAFHSPYALPKDWRIARATLAIVVAVAALRAIDLVLFTRPMSARERLAHALSVVDSSALRRAPPALDVPSLLRVAGFAVLAFAGRALVVDIALGVPLHAASLAVRWVGGLVWVYAISDMAYAAITLANRAAGFRSPVVHRDPALSRSVREFWGRRWNRVVGGWLDARLFRPLARRGHPVLGVVAAFLASTVVHVYVAQPALGTEWALVVGAFFAVQGALALAEGPLRVSRWAPAAGHAWALVAIGGTSPLFCEAFLRVMGH